MTFILSIHPIAQFVSILFVLYAAHLGLQRARSLHFGKTVKFLRHRHVITGSIGLIAMLGGIAGGYIMVSRYLLSPDLKLHETVALIILVLALFGIFSGFFLYLNPKKRLLLPVVHGINNLVILALALVQVVTGISAYLRFVLRL
jgi:uncharacterized membrane protein YfcA